MTQAKHMVTGKERSPIPDANEQNTIRRSLNMRNSERFARCRGKSKRRLKDFEAKEDFSHSKKSHICEDCRCPHVAGSWTDHYGVGFCYHHENQTGMSRTAAKEMVDMQKDAIRQGYPDRVYKYESTDQWLDKVREAADAAGGATDLREEMVVLRAKAQGLMSAFEGKENLTEGHDKEGNVRQMTDATYYKLVATMMTAVGRLTQANLAVTEHDYVHVDQVNIWFAQVIRIIQRAVEAEYPDIYESIIDEVKLVPTMKKGRIR